MIRRTLGAACALAICLAVAHLVAAQNADSRLNPDVYKQLKFRYIGPVGNRIIAIVGVPASPYIYYAGAASGGIFKTTDNGAHWDAIFDDQDVSSIGSLAVAPSDANVVWAGTGESFIRSNISIGNGIYISTDAGKTWTRVGLDKTGRIGRIVVDPKNADVVIACALGHGYGPQQERGVFRTADGGKTWARTLFVDENTGCSDVAMDAANPRILFAGMWQLEIHTWGRFSGGPGSGLFRSADGGVTWKRLTEHGLPKPPVGKISPQISRSNPSRVYAHDDGLSFSINRGRSWHHVQLPVAQMYHVTTDNQIPYNIYGNRQDGPSTRGPSNSRLAKQSDDADAGTIPRGMWHTVAGGESGWAIPDQTDNNIIWSTGTGFGSLGGTGE